MSLHCVTELGVSRPKGIRGRWYADQCISATVSLSDCPCFLDSPRMRRWVSFHVPPPSESEFRQPLPVVLRMHTLPVGTCIGRTAGRCCRNSVSDGSGAWNLTSSTHPRVGLGPILHLLDGRNALYMHMLVLLLAYIGACQRMADREWMYTGWT